MVFYEKSGIFLYSVGDLTTSRGIPIPQPASIDEDDWREYYTSFPFETIT